MTDHTDAPAIDEPAAVAEPLAAQTDLPEPVSTQDPSEDTDRPEHGGNAEAAKYRRRLRDTEAERDALAVKVAAMQTEQVHRIAAEYLSQPGDLFEVGKVELAELLNPDTGEVDPDLVALGVSALLETRPGLGKPRLPAGPSTMGMGVGSTIRPGDDTTWQDVLRRPLHR